MHVKLTRRGRRALRAGMMGELSPGAALVMEVMSRLGCASFENAAELTEQLIDRYGSPQRAMIAIKSGDVGFERD